MNPLLSEYLSRIHAEELTSQAATARRLAAARRRGARPPASPVGPLRRALGLRLVAVGLRLAGSR